MARYQPLSVLVLPVSSTHGFYPNRRKSSKPSCASIVSRRRSDLTTHINEEPGLSISWWIPTLLSAFAGGMAWGIRGQYGHETGAMIAGLLVSLVIAFLLCPKGPTLPMARAVAWGTVAMGIGGTMTYGQTVGLTHDTPLVGNVEALRWGMLGLAIKGGIWIGFAGLFLGMGLSSVRYRTLEILCLLLAMLGASYVGIQLLNEPYEPDNKILPWIYFSDDWHWEPEGGFIPRRETWGGLLFALGVAWAYVGWKRGDRLARNLGLWGILGGALGFPGGQSLQATFVWNRELFNDGFLRIITTGMNPWNIMEIGFGTIMGAVLGFGAWFHRGAMNPVDSGDESRFSVPLEWGLLAVHIALLVAVDFLSIPAADFLYDFGLVLAFLPFVVITSGRWWPYLQIFVVTLIPIAGKTYRVFGYQSETFGVIGGWIVYVIIPLVLATAFAVWSATRVHENKDSLYFTRRALLFGTWMYFGLNYAFFSFPVPWPWSWPFPWLQDVGRSQSALIFTIQAIGLTLAALLLRRENRGRTPAE